MSEVRYKEYKKKQPWGRYVWGVLRMEGRKQSFRTIGGGEGAWRKAKRLADQLDRMDAVPEDAEEQFPSWHRPGELLPSTEQT
jgi:hypothetical protein